MYAYVRTYVHACIHTRTHAHMHTLVHTDTHTHTQVSVAKHCVELSTLLLYASGAPGDEGVNAVCKSLTKLQVDT